MFATQKLFLSEIPGERNAGNVGNAGNFNLDFGDSFRGSQ